MTAALNTAAGDESPSSNMDHNNNNSLDEQQQQQQQQQMEEPEWLRSYRQNPELLAQEWGEPLVVEEWPQPENDEDDDDDNPRSTTTPYRAKHGWKGRDLIHDRHAPVRILEYYVNYGDGTGLPAGMDNDNNSEDLPQRGGLGTTLTGIVHFTPRAESHKGYCHGGSMCSVLDDVIGWCGFLITGQCRPWSGFTVQVNTQLKKPIAVHSTLLVQATITRLERRKVYIDAVLMEPPLLLLLDDNHDTETKEPKIHASGEGMVVLNRGILPELATRG
eukprot:CAMPEP_0168747806 /NCGR_PEP_ID=MMETSP0724-20121128/15847_1 /TAXON_ID=265536 /ORGANISM="Amphiprora sp., Strain CCMP467" /LENGTH=274 /DNA_ID=CAMNT_0008795609 /DNA_START=44 /DNA_END=864 /DNA_ORIENTATION=-